MLADMHTHSENSHDSKTRIEDMLLSELQNGTEIFAVTDHFETSIHHKSDIFTPIKKSFETACVLNQKYKDKALVLKGIEISEGFWCPDVCKKAANMVSFDVIIGSVHHVRYKDLMMPTSIIDFKSLGKKISEEYVDSYFNDVLTMLDKVDFDILAHLTYPLRYINGKYGVGVSLSAFDEKLERILKKTIEKNVALEINTSSYSLIEEFMPSTDIIKKYLSLGGKLITIGSDAHVKENASAHFEKVIAFLKEISVTEIYYYKNRKPLPLSI